MKSKASGLPDNCWRRYEIFHSISVFVNPGPVCINHTQEHSLSFLQNFVNLSVTQLLIA